jgi:histidyl-tRNA synthetase
MKIPPVKGTRDFYPPDMAVRNWLIDGWKKVSIRNGFEEYDGPIFEYLDMYRLKSGDEIVEQLFSLKDRGGRDLAIRPEITPTLARMVNQQINSLPQPLKWFSVPRLCRTERPQKGRLREFFQWNVDIIGIDDVAADAEVIFTACDYLRQVGLTPDDVVVKISSRKLLAAALKSFGVADEQMDLLYAILDKKTKLPQDTFEKMLTEKVRDAAVVKKICSFMEAESLSAVERIFADKREVKETLDECAELNDLLNRMGVSQYCKFAPDIVRGLAYYTGIVFEIYDRASRLRAIGGGGRYDNLLADFGGPDIPATGFGIGDCVLAILLEEKGLLKSQPRKLDYFVAGIAQALCYNKSIELTARLRRLGFFAERSYKFVSLKKQLKLASERNASYCIILGDELKDNKLVVKDMSTGTQQQIEEDRFFAQLESESK